MSGHGHGGGNPGGGPEAGAPKPATTLLEKNKGQSAEYSKLWEAAKRDKKFMQEGGFLDQHPESDVINDETTSDQERLKWYDFFKNVGEVKELVKGIFEADLRDLRGRIINLDATAETYKLLEAGIDELSKKPPENGKTAMQRVKELVTEARAFIELREKTKEREEKVLQDIKDCFSVGDPMERFAKCVNSFNQLESARRLHGQALAGQEKAKADLLVASKDLDGGLLDKLKPGFIFKKNKEKRKEAKVKVDAATLALETATKEVIAAAQVVSQRETDLHTLFGIEHHEIEENLVLIKDLYHEFDKVRTNKDKLAQSRHKISREVGKTALEQYFGVVNEAIRPDVPEQTDPTPEPTNAPGNSAASSPGSGGVVAAEPMPFDKKLATHELIASHIEQKKLEGVNIDLPKKDEYTPEVKARVEIKAKEIIGKITSPDWHPALIKFAGNLKSEIEKLGTKSDKFWKLYVCQQLAKALEDHVTASPNLQIGKKAIVGDLIRELNKLAKEFK